MRKMTRWIFTVVLALSILPNEARTESLDINGYLLNQFTAGAGKTEFGKDTLLQLNPKFQLRFFKRISPRADFLSIIDFDYFFIGETIDKGQNILLSNPDNSEALDQMFEFQPEHTLKTSIKEAIINLYLGNVNLSLGKKIIRWGASDMFGPNDKISPRDEYRMFIKQEEDIYQGVYALDVIYNSKYFNLEFVGMPDFSYVKLPLPGSIWGGEMPGEILGMPIRKMTLEVELPARKFKNFESAVKFSANIWKTDLSLYYFNIFERRPLFRNRINMNTQEIITGVLFKKTNALGLSIEKTFGSIPIRFDLNYVFKQPFVKNPDSLPLNGWIEDEIVKKNVLTISVGSDFEILKSSDLRLYMEFYNSTIFSYQKGLTQYLIPVYRNDSRLFLKLEDQYMDEHLKVGVSGLFFLSDGGKIIMPNIVYNFSEGLNFEIGANIFMGGGANSMIHFYENNDDIFCRIKYSF
ncbi:MAG: hypothetical protein ACM3SY_12525 [Candidatus Omnitrophota bacterium]